MVLSGGDATGGTPRVALVEGSGMLLVSGLAPVPGIGEISSPAPAASGGEPSRALAATWS